MLNFGKTYKYLDKISQGGWFNIKWGLTYGRPTIIITGVRSGGKSTGVACFMLLNYIFYKKKFFYVRRYLEVTRITARTFFDNAVKVINEKTDLKILDFRYRAGFFEIAFKKDAQGNPIWEQCGQSAALAQEENYKSSSFSDYDIILYDEFISKDPTKYLGTKGDTDREWNALTSFYQTIDRGVNQPFRNETVLILCANKSTIYNPICLSIGLVDYVMDGQKVTAPKNKFWVWINMDVLEIAAMPELETSFAYQMSTQETKDYAYHNKGADNNAFIKKPTIARYYGTFKLKGEKYGVYVDDEYNYYIHEPKDGYASFAADVDSHDGNDLHLVNRWRESPLMMTITDKYKQGKLFFGNGKIKNAVLKYLQFIP